MGQLIPIIPKTTYDFDGRASSTQVVVLKDRVPTVGFASGVIVVRVHDWTGLTATAEATVKVYNVSESPEDKGTFFVLRRHHRAREPRSHRRWHRHALAPHR